jgi:hypothetical protein
MWNLNLSIKITLISSYKHCIFFPFLDKIQKEKKYCCIIWKLFYLKLDTERNKETHLYLVERPSMLPNIKVLLFAIVNFCLFVFRSTFHVMASKDQFTYKTVRYQFNLNLYTCTTYLIIIIIIIYWISNACILTRMAAHCELQL